mmetsp:Transcript_32956/g.79727  ORF Transcript_32956/g.79727 Transcript_32956/m.79727 type:complete len:108 (+) Transcript_32956:511-834(+)
MNTTEWTIDHDLRSDPRTGNGPRNGNDLRNVRDLRKDNDPRSVRARLPMAERAAVTNEEYLGLLQEIGRHCLFKANMNPETTAVNWTEIFCIYSRKQTMPVVTVRAL